ncbi:MAG TPA: YMGG-like glycine zipper-containing protein [Longimicrobiales bacterium]|nr:YMGG-like glycine zipper-containing protein [Longimicrobiales bacterium]
MRVLISTLVLSTLVVASGCSREEPRQALYQDELNRELELALAAYRERETLQLNDAPQQEEEPEALPAAPRQASVAPRQSAPRTVAPRPAPQPRVVTQTNSRRDAAIGAGVGAAAGAIIHKPNRWKGAVIGAAVGGAAGAVVGATIDKKTTIVYD